MALQSQIISVPFTQGVDSKTDPKISAKPSRMENAIFVGGTIQKRPGTRSLPNRTSSGGTFSETGQLFELNGELVRTGNSTTYGFAADAQEWISKSGGGPYVIGEATQIRRNTSTQRDLDHCSINGVTYFAWCEPNGSQVGIHVAVYDEASGVYWQSGSNIIAGTASYTSPRCLVSGGKVVILITDQTNGLLGTLIYGPEDPTSGPTINLTARSDLAVTGTTSPLMDVIAVTTNNAYGAFISSGSTNKDVVIFKMVNGVITSSVSITSALSSSTPPLCANVNVSTDGYIFVFYGGLAATFRYTVYAQDLTQVLAPTTISSNIVLATSLQLAAGKILSVVSKTGFTDPIRSATVNVSGITSAIADIPLTKNLALATDAFSFSGLNAVGVAQSASDSNIQPTSWVIDTSTGAPICRLLTGLSAVTTSSQLSRIPRVVTINGQQSALFATRGRLAYSSELGRTIDKTPIGFERVLLNAVNSSKLPVTKIGNVAYVGGWLPRCYDGQVVTEAGLPIPPNIPIKGTTTGSGGSLSAGDYQVCALFSWVDAAGQLIRSPVSPVLEFTATASDSQQVKIQAMPASSRDLLPQGASVQIEIYRTEANGSIFYRDSAVSTPLLNTTSGADISFTCTQSDAALVNGEIIYTQGGVLDWLAPPPYTMSCDHKQRLMIAGLEDPYAWQSSTQEVQGEVVRFNESLGGFVPRETGKITGIASMDGNFIIFVEQGAYLVTGDGPDDLGNNNWPSPQLITSVESGAVSWQSVVSAAGAGVFFQSTRGWMLLDRGLGCTYIGADVQQFSNYTCRSGTLVPNSQRVMFLVDLGSDLPGTMSGTMVTGVGGWCLVYDYFYRQWSVFPNYGGQYSALYNGNFARINSAGIVRTEAPGTYKDDGMTYSTYVETPWIKTAGLQGFERLYLALILGTYSSNFTFNWGAAYNYVLDYSADTLSQDGQGVYDVGSVFQIRRRPRIQKCEAVKFLFWDSNLSDSGQGMSLTDLSLEIGVKKGGFKLPASRSI